MLDIEALTAEHFGADWIAREEAVTRDRAMVFFDRVQDLGADADLAARTLAATFWNHLRVPQPVRHPKPFATHSFTGAAILAGDWREVAAGLSALIRDRRLGEFRHGYERAAILFGALCESLRAIGLMAKDGAA